jgi:hypothetical protein
MSAILLTPGDIDQINGGTVGDLSMLSGCVVEPQRLWHLAAPDSSLRVTDPIIARNMMGFPLICEGTPIAKPRSC